MVIFIYEWDVKRLNENEWYLKYMNRAYNIVICTFSRFNEKWHRNDREMTEKWQRNDREMTEKWQRNDREMTEKWPRNDQEWTEKYHSWLLTTYVTHSHLPFMNGQ